MKNKVQISLPFLVFIVIFLILGYGFHAWVFFSNTLDSSEPLEIVQENENAPRVENIDFKVLYENMIEQRYNQ